MSKQLLRLLDINSCFDEHWKDLHRKYHSYTERYTVLNELEFVNGLNDIIYEIIKNIESPNNNEIGFKISENSINPTIIIDTFRCLYDLYELYKETNYLNNDFVSSVWIKLDSGFIFKLQRDYSTGVVLITKVNTNNSDIFISYDDIINKVENTNREKYKKDEILYSIRSIFKRYDCSKDYKEQIIKLL